MRTPAPALLLARLRFTRLVRVAPRRSSLPPPSRDPNICSAIKKVRKGPHFLFLPRRVLPSYLTGVTFPTTAGMVPDAAPPLLVGLATGRAVSVASRFRFIEVAVVAHTTLSTHPFSVSASFFQPQTEHSNAWFSRQRQVVSLWVNSPSPQLSPLALRAHSPRPLACPRRARPPADHRRARPPAEPCLGLGLRRSGYVSGLLVAKNEGGGFLLQRKCGITGTWLPIP